jgi:penicillin-binding protein 1A
MDPFNGHVVAVVGGTGFSAKDQNNRATHALRQPGSSFKPFVYTAAIEHGFTPYTSVSGATVSIRAGNEMWTVKGSGGIMSLASALAASINPASVRLCYRLGPSAVVEVAHRMGIRSKLDPVYSISLGSEEVTVLDMATAYCCFANGGNRVEPTTIERVYDCDGVLVDEPVPTRERVLSMHTAYTMNQMLQGVVSHGTGTAAGGLGVPTAGKTGTTDDHRDTWFVGLTPQLVCAVWGGRDTGEMGGGYGGHICAPTFKDIVSGALDAIGRDTKLDFPGPGDERIRQRINIDAALTAGGAAEEEKPAESAGGGRPVIDLAPEPGGQGKHGGPLPSYVIPPSPPAGH